MKQTFQEQLRQREHTLRWIYHSPVVLWVLVLIGIALHLIEYGHNRSLWVDEAGVAITVIERPYSELLPSSVEQGTDYAQTAPTGFLLAVKTGVNILGDSEYALKLIPVLGGILALVLFLKLAPQSVQPTAVPLAMLLLATSNALITLATSLKQYSLDVVFTLLLALFFLKILSRPFTIAQMGLWGLIGAVAIWCSHPVIFILASGSGLVFVIWAHQKQWQAIRLFWLPVGCWVGSFGIKYGLLLRRVTDNTEVRQFWSTEFMPFPPKSWEQVGWFGQTFFETLRYALQLPRPFMELLARLDATLASIVGTSPSLGASLKTLSAWVITDLFWLVVYLVIAGLFIIGCVAMFTKNRRVFALISLTILLTLGASGVYAYPFGNRLILFLVPFLLLVMAEGTAFLFSKHHVAGIACLGVLIFYPLSSAGSYILHPRIHEQARPVVKYLKEHRQSGDPVYVYYGGQQVFAYYARRFDLDPQGVIQGIASRDDWQQYLGDIDRLRGLPRVWLFFSHAYNEEAFFLAYLDSFGQRLETATDIRASVYLYNLE